MSSYTYLYIPWCYLAWKLIELNCQFIRPHPDYVDITYDQVYNSSFHQNITSIQYNAVLAIMDTVIKTFREKLYQELGLNLFKTIACIEKCVATSHQIIYFT